jgi:hypothetical protein
MTPSYTNGDATNGYYHVPGSRRRSHHLRHTHHPQRHAAQFTTLHRHRRHHRHRRRLQRRHHPERQLPLHLRPRRQSPHRRRRWHDPGENGDAIEAYLDTEVANGIAPNANVILYTAADTTLNAGLFLAIQRALDDNQADILNVSFGGCEAVQGTSGNQYIQNLWQQAAAQGITVTVSTGDSGSAGCDDPNSEYVAGIWDLPSMASVPLPTTSPSAELTTTFSTATSPPASPSTSTSPTPSPTIAALLGYIPEEPWNNSTLSWT